MTKTRGKSKPLMIKDIPINAASGFVALALLVGSVLIADRLFLDGVLTGQGKNSPQVKSLMKELKEERQKNARLEEELRLITEELQEVKEKLGAPNDEGSSESETPASSDDIQSELAELRKTNSFLENMKEAVSGRDDIEFYNGKFAFKEEVFFYTASDVLTEEAQQTLDKVAENIKEIVENIPEDTGWIIRVEGHADARKLKHRRPYSSNWMLSSARAISIVQYLVSKGVSPNHLYAAGFSHYQPEEDGNGPKVWKENRRSIIAFDQK